VKRLRSRRFVSALLLVSLGVFLFGVIYAIVVGKNDAVGLAAFVGILAFLVGLYWFVVEVNLAIEAVNLRVDRLAGHGPDPDPDPPRR
jgi:xanthosine utilization system XapX-like protein